MVASLLRLIVRRSVRGAIAIAPARLQRRVPMLPFSRFARLIPLLFRGDERVQWRNITLHVDPGETFGYFLFFCGEDERDPEFDWLVEQSQEARHFADIGAHIGMYTIAIAALRPSIRVTAFEASAAIAARLRANIASNAEVASRITVVEKAVSDSTGTRAFLDHGGANSAVGRLIADGDFRSRATPVAAVTLSDYFSHRPPPDLVKIDVEGAELEVLRGWDTLPAPRAMLVELHAPLTTDVPDQRLQVLQWFHDRGYRLEYLVDEVRTSEFPKSMPARLHVLATHSGP